MTIAPDVTLTSAEVIAIRRLLGRMPYGGSAGIVSSFSSGAELIAALDVLRSTLEHHAARATEDRRDLGALRRDLDGFRRTLGIPDLANLITELALRPPPPAEVIIAAADLRRITETPYTVGDTTTTEEVGL